MADAGKRWFMDNFGLFFAFAIPLAFLTLLILWTATDAIKRGKSPLLVCLLVILSFPVGLVAWLIFRPETGTPSKRRFNLEDYRSG
jgi:uncharacterized membrane protein